MDEVSQVDQAQHHQFFLHILQLRRNRPGGVLDDNRAMRAPAGLDGGRVVAMRMIPESARHVVRGQLEGKIVLLSRLDNLEHVVAAGQRRRVQAVRVEVRAVQVAEAVGRHHSVEDAFKPSPVHQRRPTIRAGVLQRVDQMNLQGFPWLDPDRRPWQARGHALCRVNTRVPALLPVLEPANLHGRQRQAHGAPDHRGLLELLALSGQQARQSGPAEHVFLLSDASLPGVGLQQRRLVLTRALAMRTLVWLAGERGPRRRVQQRGEGGDGQRCAAGHRFRVERGFAANGRLKAECTYPT
mmetsp:Transcript_134672/g.430175  ORF Transcript_134672/g.430175 Transcript_134672/m.430175 type:complete len:298 (+) Transcript_134672:1490-2383(+)